MKTKGLRNDFHFPLIFLVGKITEKAVCRSVLKHTPSDCFFGDFAPWDYTKNKYSLNSHKSVD